MIVSSENIRDIVKEWSTHLAVTLSIVIAFELWNRSQRRNNYQYTTPSTPRITDKIESEKNQHRHTYLLDKLEERQAQQLSKIELGNSFKPESNNLPIEKQPLTKSSGEETRKKVHLKGKKSSIEAPGNNIDSPPPIKATSNKHPGMEGYNHWYDVECSLYRIYTLGRKDDVQVTPPYVPHSYRGTVPIHLRITNATKIPIKVFWVNYQGQSIFKGDLKPHHVWTQTTWIDHPWVFEHAETQEPLLYYIPYRAVPTSRLVSTISGDGTGQHKFSLRDGDGPFWIGVKDDVMPFPATENFSTFLLGVNWTLQHMSRLMSPDDPSIEILQKYLTNIIENPANTKYRQIRLRSPKFAPIWLSTLRGLLLAIGFVEHQGFADFGCAEELSRERVQEVALLSYLINKWKEDEQRNINENLQQPEGANGFGRQGFGRAGTLN